jgi:Na+-driven multidrug efflux pump
MGNGVTQIRRSVMTLALPVTLTTLLQRAEGIVAVFFVGGLGVKPTTLGQHIFRAETAAITTISSLQSRLGVLG